MLFHLIYVNLVWDFLSRPVFCCLSCSSRFLSILVCPVVSFVSFVFGMRRSPAAILFVCLLVGLTLMKFGGSVAEYDIVPSLPLTTSTPSGARSRCAWWWVSAWDWNFIFMKEFDLCMGRVNTWMSIIYAVLYDWIIIQLRNCMWLYVSNCYDGYWI